MDVSLNSFGVNPGGYGMGGLGSALDTLNPQKKKNNNGIDYMDYDEAYSQAEKILQPKFNQQMQNLSNQQINRGFYGQMPGDVMQQELAGQQEAQIANQALNLQQQDFNRQLKQAQFNWRRNQAKKQRQQQQSSNFWGTIGTIAGGFLGGPAGGVIGRWLGNQLGGTGGSSGSNQNTSGFSLDYNKNLTL
jgi:hypothetical protein